MNGGGCCTTRTWPPPSSTGSWNEEDSSASMDPRDGHVISNWRTPCQTVQNGSEYLEKTAQNFRNPQRVAVLGKSVDYSVSVIKVGPLSMPPREGKFFRSGRPAYTLPLRFESH